VSPREGGNLVERYSGIGDGVLVGRAYYLAFDSADLAPNRRQGDIHGPRLTARQIDAGGGGGEKTGP